MLSISISFDKNSGKSPLSSDISPTSLEPSFLNLETLIDFEPIYSSVTAAADHMSSPEIKIKYSVALNI